MDAQSAGKVAADLVLAAVDLPSAGEPPTSYVGQVWAGVTFAVLSFFGLVATIYSFRSGFKSAARPERTRIEALSLTDTDALADRLAKQLLADLTPRVDQMLSRGVARDERQAEQGRIISEMAGAMKRVLEIQERGEIRREERERVEREHWPHRPGE